MKLYLLVYWNDCHCDVQTECLRYMGNPPCLAVKSGHYYYKQPKGILFRPWSKANIARMKTFGIEAKTLLAELGD